MSLWNQTVTVYRRQGDGVTRRVLHGCFYRHKLEEQTSPEGVRQERKFLLIAPGEGDILPGDRIYDGEGPQVVDWDWFLPVNVPGLSQAAYAESWYLAGQLHHTEAGRK